MLTSVLVRRFGCVRVRSSAGRDARLAFSIGDGFSFSGAGPKRVVFIKRRAGISD